MFGLTFLVFLVLKLTHVINWSWWWITAPLWGSVLLSIPFIIIYVRYEEKRQKDRHTCMDTLSEMLRKRDELMKQKDAGNG